MMYSKNYNDALRKAQAGTTIKPKKYQSTGIVDPGLGQSVVPDNSQLRQRTALGTLGTKIGNIFRPDHRDLNTDGTFIDVASRKNIPTFTSNLGEGAYVDPTSIAGSSLYKNGGGVGSSNYMEAMKKAKKSGRK